MKLTIDALYVAAVLCGIASAWCGNRTAYALLASAAVTSALIGLEAPFSLRLWLLIDVAVIVAIFRLKHWEIAPSDWLVIALFAPAWTFYFLPDVIADGTTLVASLQFLMVAPFARAWAAVRHRSRHAAKWDEFDLRDQAGAT
jgi:hypothetical protein